MSMRHGTYIGDNLSLKGKTALLLINEANPGEIKAQFDDITTGHGYGWHKFSTDEFELDPQ